MFDRFVGNDGAKALLLKVLAAGRVPGALLFAGPNGVGKRQFAIVLAASLLCRKANGGVACGDCSVCMRVWEFNLPDADKKDANEKIHWSHHPDLGLLRRAGKNIRVDEMRIVEREANLRPYEGDARIFIIDEAEDMHASSANALLKTLEEPPASVHVILVTAQPSALLATIRSRCQVVRFGPIDAADIAAHLGATKQYSDADAQLLARVSAGSIGRALSLDLPLFLDQREAMLRALEAVALSSDTIALLRITEEMNDAKHKDDFEACIDVLEFLLQDLLRLAYRAGTERLINQDVAQRLQKIADSVAGPDVSNWIMDIERLRQRFAVNINRKVSTDALFLNMLGASAS